MKVAAILLAAAVTGCATPQRPQIAAGAQPDQAQIEATRTDVYVRFMRFQAWLLGLTRFEW